MNQERIIEVNIEEEMKKSYLAYSMSVIVARALPDVRDGLKPVHRRILYAMQELGLDFNRPYKKSARIVGEVLGKYHPHGDTAVYDAMVRMVQEFSLRYPLINGQGNFGSVDGDSAAAMRYTEARLHKITQLLLQDIDKNTVDFTSNFDDTLKEPSILPTVIPNIMLNGSSGIAVGMSTNIPPHNLAEVVDALIQLVEYPEIENSELMKNVKGPDFPTGGLIVGTQGIRSMYETGRGRIIMRARTFIETTKQGKDRIVVTELPYQVNKANLITQIADLVKDKKIEQISDIRDESDRDGIRIVIELKKDAVPRVVLNNLFKHSNLQCTFGAIMLMLVNKIPQTLCLKEILEHFLKFRHEVILRRTRFELENAEKRAHILEGLKIALANLDEVIQIIRQSRNPEIAKQQLMSHFQLSDLQAQAILDLRLQRLTSLEQEKIENEYLELIKVINRLREILANYHLQMQVIKDELLQAKKDYQDPRRTEITFDESDSYEIRDLIADEEVVVTISHKGYIKRTTVNNYRLQKRGGRGANSMNIHDDDYVEHIFTASTHDKLLVFTTLGRVYALNVYEIPESARTARGKAIVNLLNMGPDENLTNYMAIREFKENAFIFMTTRKGVIKKTSLDAFANIRRDGIRAINVDEDDRLIGCKLTNGQMEIILATRKGKSIRFHESQVRSMGRTAHGVRGINLAPKDEVVGMLATRGNYTLSPVTNGGYGKRSDLDEYRIQSRGGKGIINIKSDTKRGDVINILEIRDDDQLMVITKKGILIRTSVKEINTASRNTKGVKVINLDEDDQVIDITPVVIDDEDETTEQ